jgi:hypothetical protein
VLWKLGNEWSRTADSRMVLTDRQTGQLSAEGDVQQRHGLEFLGSVPE